MVIGLIMFLALPILPIVLFFLQYSISAPELIPFLMAFIVIGAFGGVICMYYLVGHSTLFRGIDILRRMAPPEPFIEGKLAVLNKDPVYVIARWGLNTLFFVAFYESERSFDKKVKLPRVIRIWEYNRQLGDVRVARKEDEFSIPVDRDTFYRGRGILYALMLEERFIVTFRKRYTVDELNQVADRLAQEVSSYGSDSQSFTDSE
ncbi:MAG: hypothetical protein ACFFCP_06100 [Promethearchaeota archaeon]